MPSKWRCGTSPAKSTTRLFTRWWAAASFATKFAFTPTPPNPKIPKIYAQRMKERKEGMGITWLKMDLGVEMVVGYARHAHVTFGPEPVGA